MEVPNIERQIRNIFSIYARSQCNEGYKIISGPTRVTVKSKKRYDPYSLIKNIACSIFLVVADILQISRFFLQIVIDLTSSPIIDYSKKEDEVGFFCSLFQLHTRAVLLAFK